MPDFRFATCRCCGRSRDEVGPLSWTRLCLDCGLARMTENIIGLHRMEGEPARRWREGMARSVGAVLLDAVRDSAQTVAREPHS